MPAALTKRLQEHPGHSLKYSVSMSFYHSSSKRFFGSTWMGFKQSPPKKGGENLLFNEVVYWSSSVVDPNCFSVIELVATEVDNSSGVVMGQYGCGWAMLQPFGDVGIKDISLENKLGEEGKAPLPIEPQQTLIPHHLLNAFQDTNPSRSTPVPHVNSVSLRRRTSTVSMRFPSLVVASGTGSTPMSALPSSLRLLLFSKKTNSLALLIPLAASKCPRSNFQMGGESPRALSWAGWPLDPRRIGR